MLCWPKEEEQKVAARCFFCSFLIFFFGPFRCFCCCCPLICVAIMHVIMKMPKVNILWSHNEPNYLKCKNQQQEPAARTNEKHKKQKQIIYYFSTHTRTHTNVRVVHKNKYVANACTHTCREHIMPCADICVYPPIIIISNRGWPPKGTYT